MKTATLQDLRAELEARTAENAELEAWIIENLPEQPLSEDMDRALLRQNDLAHRIRHLQQVLEDAERPL